MQISSNGSKIVKRGPGFHKCSDYKVLWDLNEPRNEEDSTSVVLLPAFNYNQHIKNSFKLNVNL